MVTIKVNSMGHGEPLEFQVVLLEGKSQAQYVVTMARRTWEDLTPGSTAEACIEAAFRFLLDRESQESILKRFDVAVIPRYFPDFERALPRYLSKS
jgi:hypothetical protein